MRHISRFLGVSLLALLMLASCKPEPKPTPKAGPKKPAPARIKIPKFSGDTAYALIEKQLSFGTRVPGSTGHQAQKAWMVDFLKAKGAKVYEQDFYADFMGKTGVKATNIVAEFNPEKKERFLLAAHWDTRLIAEKDKNEDLKDKPIMGADDGASGVAILMEIARILEEHPIDVGIDLLFFDAEDNGDAQGDYRTWCLGSQHWGKQQHRSDYNAVGGILLDLVGAKDNIYNYDDQSQKYAPKLQKAVWQLARGMGNTDLFQETVVPVIDDHIFVNMYAGIPMIDIIGTPQAGGTSIFGPHHHTHDDDIDVISQRTLKKTGQVVTAVIYKFSEGSFVW